MKIEHVALWTIDIERLKNFYLKYFQAHAGKKYINHVKRFGSYFLTFDEGSRMELMQMEGVGRKPDGMNGKFLGLAHFAISVGSKQKVDLLTEKLRQDGFSIVGEPRTTGDGYYESVVLDPEGNRIEITE